MFYTIVINTAQAIFAYETMDGATEKFHSELSYAINQHIHTTCVVMDSHGAVYRSEEFVPAVEPEGE